MHGCPKLRIPWPQLGSESPRSPGHEEENWKSLERWADGMLKCQCDSCGGGSAIYCHKGNIDIEWNGEGFGSGSVEKTLELTASSTVGLVCSFFRYSEGVASLSGTVFVNESRYVEPGSSGSAQYPDEGFGQTFSINSAFTRSSGTHDLRVQIEIYEPTAPYVGFAGGVGYELLLIVGSDTGDDCLQSIS